MNQRTATKWPQTAYSMSLQFGYLISSVWHMDSSENRVPLSSHWIIITMFTLKMSTTIPFLDPSNMDGNMLAPFSENSSKHINPRVSHHSPYSHGHDWGSHSQSRLQGWCQLRQVLEVWRPPGCHCNLQQLQDFLSCPQQKCPKSANMVVFKRPLAKPSSVAVLSLKPCEPNLVYLTSRNGPLSYLLSAHF